jgi:hypothetical protein
MVMDGLNLFILTTKKSALDAWQNAIANNTAYSLECRMRQKMVLFWWLVRAVPVLDKKEMLSNGLEHVPIYKTSKKQESNY